MFDVANRLATYTTGGTTTSFTYDADGTRVVRDEGDNETIYVGGIFEVDDTSTRSYYSFAGTVVAYRLQEGTTDERFYLISDHLGTNSHQVKYSDGTRSSQYYLPFGGDRGSTAGNLDTDRGYTGQTSDAAFSGLLFYNARYYDPTLRRFISADTIIPDPGNPQDLNRYSYVRNNPVRYSDPSGNTPVELMANHGDPTQADCITMGLGARDCAMSFAFSSPGKVGASDVAIATGFLGAAVFAPEIIVGAGAITEATGAAGTSAVVRCMASTCGVVAAAIVTALERLKEKLPKASEWVDRFITAITGQSPAVREALSGGANSGMLQNYIGRSTAEMERGIRSLQQQIDKHLSWIADPYLKIPDFAKLDPRQQLHLVTSKWPADIQRQRDQIDILRYLIEQGES